MLGPWPSPSSAVVVVVAAAAVAAVTLRAGATANFLVATLRDNVNTIVLGLRKELVIDLRDHKHQRKHNSDWSSYVIVSEVRGLYPDGQTHKRFPQDRTFMYGPM